ncbi:Uncharacterized protein FWK35_00027814, partial [Aphis craccivora]
MRKEHQHVVGQIQIILYGKARPKQSSKYLQIYPRYPLSIWNVRNQTLSNSHRTNNFSEGWNRTTNLSFWTVLRAIQLDECGNRLQKRQKSFTAGNNKLFNLCNQHQRKELTNIEFLNS